VSRAESSPGPVEVDLDRLADYAAGVLDNAAAADVSRLIATEPGWSSAYLALVAADAATRRELRAYAQSHLEPMPGDVVARLEKAFEAPTRTPVAARHAHVASIAEARRRRRVFAGLAAAAAAVVAIAGGLTVAGRLIDRATTSNSAGGSTTLSEDGAAPAPQLAAGLPPVLASGSDYRRETLATFEQYAFRAAVPSGGTAPTPLRDSRSSTTSKDSGLGGSLVREDVAAALRRLAEPTALRTCLDAIATTHPGVATAVDFARFDGTPALIVLVQTGQGGSTVVAVGPGCGVAGTDEKASAPVK
jgi:hypothetical protein